MNLDVAILTGDRAYGQWLRRLLLPHVRVPIRIVRDEVDLSFRPLRRSDLVLFGSDLTGQRVLKVLRALRALRVSARTVVLMQSRDSVDEAFEFFSLDAWAIVLEEDREDDLPQALAQMRRDRRFLSPRLLMPMLQRYRELLGELRQATGGKRTLSDYLSR